MRGTCAHLYVVEEADTELGVVNHWPLVDRLKIALKLVDLVIVRRLYFSSIYNTIFTCVKLSNVRNNTDVE